MTEFEFGGRIGRQFAIDHGDDCDRKQGSEYCSCKGGLRPVEEADLISSELEGSRMHMPVIDIDMPCRLVESSPGKFHLYIDKPMTWQRTVSLVRGMVRAGVVEPGYYEACADRGYFSVRHPDRLKPRLETF